LGNRLPGPVGQAQGIRQLPQPLEPPGRIPRDGPLKEDRRLSVPVVMDGIASRGCSAVRFLRTSARRHESEQCKEQ
jgi:hypothetical protein